MDERHWLTLAEFAEIASFAQSFPGAIFFNLAVAIGMRERGVAGAAAALGGILVPAITVACAVERLQTALDANLLIHRILAGIVAAAAGLFASTFLQISKTTWERFRFTGIALAAFAFYLIVARHVPLPYVILGLLPLGIGLAWRSA